MVTPGASLDNAPALSMLRALAVIVVARRLGHAKTDITNDIYAHALPSMQKDAAAKIGAQLR